MIAGDIPDLPDFVARGSLRVHAPTSVIFICGGEVDLNAKHPLSLRDAFLRISHKSAVAKFDVRRAEEMEWAFPTGEYIELLEFESDIAQISDLIVLFSESAGSVAELGSFVRDDEIARRMLVFVDNKNFENPSFIKLALLDYLTRTYGEDYVSVLRITEFKVDDIRVLEKIDLEKFRQATDGPLSHRTKQRHEPRTFDKSRNGHVTKLIVGLIQQYAALTLDEIDVLLFCLDVPTSQAHVKKHLRCAELFGWVLKEKIGITTYFAAIEGNRALHFELASEIGVTDRVRWRTDIIEYWRNNDPERFSSIKAALAKART